MKIINELRGNIRIVNFRTKRPDPGSWTGTKTQVEQQTPPMERFVNRSVLTRTRPTSPTNNRSVKTAVTCIPYDRRREVPANSASRASGAAHMVRN